MIQKKPIEKESLLWFIHWMEVAEMITRDKNELGQVALALYKYGFCGIEYTGNNHFVQATLRGATNPVLNERLSESPRL